MNFVSKISCFLLVSLSLTATSCAPESTTEETTEVIAKEIGQVTIHFKNGYDEMQEVFKSTDKTEFAQFTTLISDKTAPQYKCGYSGNVTYTYVDGSVRDCDFNIDESCNHIVYMENDDLVSRELTSEGREALLTLMEKGGIIVSSGVELPMVPDVPEVDIEKLTTPMMESLKKNYHPDIYEGNGPDEVIINKHVFRPNPSSDYYVYVQVIHKRGEVSIDDFVVYYPDDVGVFSPEKYFITTEDEHPCSVCDILEIISDNNNGPKGLFEDRASGEKFELNMGYNLQEIYFYWYE